MGRNKGRTNDTLVRVAGLALALFALIGAFEPGTLETLLWLHMEVVVLCALLLATSFVGRSVGTIAMQVIIACVAAPFALLLTLGAWFLAFLLFTGGGPMTEGADPLIVATHTLVDQGLSSGLSAFWYALGPSAAWVVAGSVLFHLAVTFARHRSARLALAAHTPPLQAEARAAAEDAQEPSALLLKSALIHASGLFVASLVTVVPVALSLVSLEDQSPWPSYIVLVGVRLGVEAWHVTMDHAEPEWVLEKRRLEQRG